MPRLRVGVEAVVAAEGEPTSTHAATVLADRASLASVAAAATVGVVVAGILARAPA